MFTKEILKEHVEERFKGDGYLNKFTLYDFKITLITSHHILIKIYILDGDLMGENQMSIEIEEFKKFISERRIEKITKIKERICLTKE